MQSIINAEDFEQLNNSNNYNNDLFVSCRSFLNINNQQAQKIENLREDATQFIIYYNSYSNILMNRFKWNCSSVKSRLIERLLYYFGSCAIVNINNELKPYNYIINEYNADTLEPKSIDIIDMMGNVVKSNINNKDFVIIYDNIDKLPKAYTTYIYSVKLAHSQRAINNNIKKQFTPIIFSGSSEQKKALEILSRKYEQGINYWFCDKDYLQQISTLDLKIDFKALELFDVSDRIKNDYFSLVGINNENVTKQSGVTEAEVNANNEYINNIIDAQLQMRLEAIEEFNEKFGVQMEVFINV